MTLASEFLGGVKGIQRGTITSTGATTNTATVTAVDPSRCILRATTITPAFNGITGYNFGKIALTNSTTITMTSYSSQSGIVLRWELIEFYAKPAIKSIQYVSSTANAGSVSFSAVDPLKAVISWLGMAGVTSTAQRALRVQCDIFDATSALVTESEPATANGTNYFQVVEFY